MRERPTGVTILAILAVVAGVFGILGGLALFGLGGMLGAAGGGGLAGMAAIFGLVTLALGVAYLALAYGFWNLAPWAWTLGVGLAVFQLVWIAIQAVLSGDIVNALVGSIVSIAVAAVILYYLMQPHVKAAFGRP